MYVDTIEYGIVPLRQSRISARTFFSMSSFQTKGYLILKKLPFFFGVLLESWKLGPIEHADFGFVLDLQLVQGLSVSGDGVGGVLAEQNPVVIVVQVYNQLHRLGADGPWCRS